MNAAENRIREEPETREPEEDQAEDLLFDEPEYEEIDKPMLPRWLHKLIGRGD